MLVWGYRERVQTYSSLHYMKWIKLFVQDSDIVYIDLSTLESINLKLVVKDSDIMIIIKMIHTVTRKLRN